MERQWQPPAKDQASAEAIALRDLRLVFQGPLKGWLKSEEAITAVGPDEAMHLLKEKIGKAELRDGRKLTERVAERMAGTLAILREFGDGFWVNQRTASRRRTELRLLGIVVDRTAPAGFRVPLDAILRSLSDAWEPIAEIDEKEAADWFPWNVKGTIDLVGRDALTRAGLPPTAGAATGTGRRATDQDDRTTPVDNGNRPGRPSRSVRKPGAHEKPLSALWGVIRRAKTSRGPNREERDPGHGRACRGVTPGTATSGAAPRHDKTMPLLKTLIDMFSVLPCLGLLWQDLLTPL